MSTVKIGRWGVAVTVTVAMVLALPAVAHHSFVVYDMHQTKSADATIKEFNFGAPHSTATFTILGANGVPQDITLQGAAPGALRRAGFNPRELRRGTKVHVSWHPVKTGGPEGSLVTLTLSDGRSFTDPGANGLPPIGVGGGGGPGGPPGAAPGTPPPSPQ